MPASGRPFRVSLQTKVMAAVLAVLIVLPAVTLWIVNARLERQMQVDAEVAASTARRAFVQMLKVRAEELASRARFGLNDQRFLRILRLGDEQTMVVFLRELLEEFRDDTELAAYVTLNGEIWGAQRKGVEVTAASFAGSLDSLVRSAFGGATRTASVALGGAAYTAIVVPVAPPEGLHGALIFGIRTSDATLRDIAPPASEILLVAGERVVASTLQDSAQAATIVQQLRALRSARSSETPITIAGQRFKPMEGALDGVSGQAPVTYVLLSSIEQRLGSLEQTRAVLLALTAMGVLVSAGVVALFVGRITRPLIALRDSAEAVGRGDFSRRIERFSNDECGDLAETFNRMTTNLQSSRAELEKAVQQVKTTQEQLIQSEKLSAVGQFVAGVAHELNNPLTAVVGFSELLQNMSQDPKTNDFLERIAKSAHRCHKIVQSLLGFARQHPPERKRLALHAVVDEVLEIMAYDLRTSNVTIVREFAPALPGLIGDSHQLQQVFINIISNARQAMDSVRRSGEIVIRTVATDATVRIEFRDNGPGIRPEHLARIFDPFFTTKPVGKGTGLGLSLCYGIIREHGGTITARSELGKGATFSIELPAAPSEVPEVDGKTGSAPPFSVPAAPSGKKVLVVDDETWILDLAAELLRRDGHSVEAVVGGDRAMERLAQQKYDIVLLDWKMPGKNGLDVYEWLKARDPVAAGRVLFMTGDVVNTTFQDFLRDNGVTCLAKPFALREFRAAVAKYVR